VAIAHPKGPTKAKKNCQKVLGDGRTTSWPKWPTTPKWPKEPPPIFFFNLIFFKKIYLINFNFLIFLKIFFNQLII
jgi:hypothetical protein